MQDTLCTDRAFAQRYLPYLPLHTSIHKSYAYIYSSDISRRHANTYTHRTHIYSCTHTHITYYTIIKNLCVNCYICMDMLSPLYKQTST